MEFISEAWLKFQVHILLSYQLNYLKIVIWKIFFDAQSLSDQLSLKANDLILISFRYIMHCTLPH